MPYSTQTTTASANSETKRRKNNQILRTYGRHFTQIRKRYSDGHNGGCVIGVVMSYYGWNGIADPDNPTRILATVAIYDEQVSVINLVKLNDSNMTFEEIANYLDKQNE